MKLAWATDTHLDMVDDAFVVGEVMRANVACDALLITGDVAASPSLVSSLRDIRRGIAVPVYFILGNHDYWYGGFVETHARARLATAEIPGVTWLREAGVVQLSERVALVGTDGFYDAGYGKPHDSGVVMNDWRKIEELRGPLFDGTLLTELRYHGQLCATEAEPVLRDALDAYPEVIFATHVPPWPEAAWHKGQRTDPECLPWYTSRAMGEMLARVAAEYPHRQIRVLCGHVHSPGEAQIADNLRCSTGAAEYGAPAVWTVIDTDSAMGAP